MALRFVYEQAYAWATPFPPPTQGMYGWWDDSGISVGSWFDEALTDTPIILYYVLPSFHTDPDTIYPIKKVSVWCFPALYVDPDIFFRPMSARLMIQSHQMLKNEVRRIR